MANIELEKRLLIRNMDDGRFLEKDDEIFSLTYYDDELEKDVVLFEVSILDIDDFDITIEDGEGKYMNISICDIIDFEY